MKSYTYNSHSLLLLLIFHWQTDHDPRNPAYIATQGPLPNTAADFWQMVWEQGSVVIVNLTRLTENTTALCHRYWPEEGSELHHIYEVGLS
jgi:receptor-type tyrosine-protein phosphatase N